MSRGVVIYKKKDGRVKKIYKSVMPKEADMIMTQDIWDLFACSHPLGFYYKAFTGGDGGVKGRGVHFFVHI